MLSESLQHPVSAEGELIEFERAEPIAADFRPEGAIEQGWTTAGAYRRALLADGNRRVNDRISRYQRRSQLAKLKIIAGVLGVPLGKLSERDKAYQLELARKKARDIRRWSIAVGILAILAIAGGLVAHRKRTEAEEQRRIAEEERVATEAERQKQEETLWKASRADHEAALLAIGKGDFSTALAYLARALELQPKNTTALAASANFAIGPGAPRFFTRFITADAGLSFGSDGRYLINWNDKTVRLIDVATGKVINRMQFGEGVRFRVLSKDGRWLAAATGNVVAATGNVVQVFEVATGNEVSRIQCENPVRLFDFSPDGRWVAVVSGESNRVIENTCSTTIRSTLLKWQHWH